MTIILRNKMPIVKIFNRDYQIACGEGEEKKLFDLAKKLDKRLHENASIFKGANENMLMILTALTLEDFAQDLDQQNILLQNKLNQAEKSTYQGIDKELNEMADHIDSLVTKLIKS